MKILGALCIAIPFIGAFALFASMEGLFETLGALLLVAAVCGLFLLGFWLMDQ